MNRLSIMLAAMLVTPLQVFAAPPTQVAWTHETIKLVKSGNLFNGKKLAESCAACHGEKGISQVAEYPSLAGQLANYTYKQLRDYQDGNRTDPMMSSMVSELSKEDMADLAVWFASLPLPQQKTSTLNVDKAEVLVFHGDSKRTLPPCNVCHGKSGQGEARDTPALAGQQASYLEKTLKAYKSAQRRNDIYSRMRLIVEQLSEQEINELAQYYQSLASE